MSLWDILFGDSKEDKSVPFKREPLEGWIIFSKSKHPERQVVLDYMAQYGIELVKSPNGIYYVNNWNCSDFDDFMRLTNYRATRDEPCTRKF